MPLLSRFHYAYVFIIFITPLRQLPLAIIAINIDYYLLLAPYQSAIAIIYADAAIIDDIMLILYLRFRFHFHERHYYIAYIFSRHFDYAAFIIIIFSTFLRHYADITFITLLYYAIFSFYDDADIAIMPLPLLPLLFSLSLSFFFSHTPHYYYYA